MTITGLFRRFGSNVKMFPTLALVTLIVAVAEIDIVSTFFGFWKMVNVFTTEAILAFALAYIILNKSPNFATSVQTFVDRLMDPNTSWYAPYAHNQHTTVYEREDNDVQYDDDCNDDEQEPLPGVMTEEEKQECRLYQQDEEANRG